MAKRRLFKGWFNRFETPPELKNDYAVVDGGGKDFYICDSFTRRDGTIGFQDRDDVWYLLLEDDVILSGQYGEYLILNVGTSTVKVKPPSFIDLERGVDIIQRMCAGENYENYPE